MRASTPPAFCVCRRIIMSSDRCFYRRQDYISSVRRSRAQNRSRADQTLFSISLPTHVSEDYLTLEKSSIAEQAHVQPSSQESCSTRRSASSRSVRPTSLPVRTVQSTTDVSKFKEKAVQFCKKVKSLKSDSNVSSHLS